MHPHEFPGLDGGNLLGFLAALGTLRVLSLESSDPPADQPAPALSWREHGGVWMPVLHHPVLATREALLGELKRRCQYQPTERRQNLEEAERRLNVHEKAATAARAKLKGADKASAKERLKAEKTVLEEHVFKARQVWVAEAAPAFSLGANLSVAPAHFARYVQSAADHAKPDARDWADYAAAFGSELYPRQSAKGETVIQDTAFRTMSGAGHQDFLGTMINLYEATTTDHFSRALFEEWNYDDVGMSLRWDPADDRRYALRFYNPKDTGSASPILTVRGANRLAVEAIPLFPTFLVGSDLETTAFRRDGKDRILTWPVWSPPLGLDAVRSALGLAVLWQEKPPRSELTARGITQAYRARRFVEGNYINFSPSAELL